MRFTPVVVGSFDLERVLVGEAGVFDQGVALPVRFLWLTVHEDVVRVGFPDESHSRPGGDT